MVISKLLNGNEFHMKYKGNLRTTLHFKSLLLKEEPKWDWELWRAASNKDWKQWGPARNRCPGEIKKHGKENLKSLLTPLRGHSFLAPAAWNTSQLKGCHFCFSANKPFLLSSCWNFLCEFFNTVENRNLCWPTTVHPCITTLKSEAIPSFPLLLMMVSSVDSLHFQHILWKWGWQILVHSIILVIVIVATFLVQTL
jgi:hypothetical protein